MARKENFQEAYYDSSFRLGESGRKSHGLASDWLVTRRSRGYIRLPSHRGHPRENSAALTRSGAFFQAFLSQGCTCLISWTSQLRISAANQSSLLKLNDWSKIMDSPIVVAFFSFFIYFYFILVYIFLLYMADVSEIE